MTLPEISAYTPSFSTRPQIPPVTTTLPAIGARQQAVRVKGYDGAMALAMGPDSSALALDEDLDVLWIIMTDQQGNKVMVEGREIGNKYEPPKAVTMEDLLAEMRAMKSEIEQLKGGGAHELHSGTDAAVQPGSAGNQPG